MHQRWGKLLYLHFMLTKIDSKSQWLDFRELWAYRELILLYILRDYKIRYRYTIAGVFWYLFQPVFNLLLFYLIFKAVGKVNYGVQSYWTFALTGIILWLQLEHGIQDAFETISGSKEIIKKIYFPIILLPVYKTIVNALDTLVLLVLLNAFFAVSGMFYFKPLAFLIYWFLYTMLCLGINIGVYSILMRFRDARFLVPPVIRILFLGSAVLYPVAALPAHWQQYLWLNPVTSFIQLIRGTVLEASASPMVNIWYVVLVPFAVLMIGTFVYELVKDKIVDYL